MEDKSIDYLFLTIWNMFIVLTALFCSLIYDMHWAWLLLLTYKIYSEN